MKLPKPAHTARSRSARLSVSVIETTKPDKVLVHLDGLRQAMSTMREEQNLDDVLLFVVDILQALPPCWPRRPHIPALAAGAQRGHGCTQERAVFISSSSSASELVERAWECEVGADGTTTLASVLRCATVPTANDERIDRSSLDNPIARSRKKQILPALENAAAGGAPIRLVSEIKQEEVPPPAAPRWEGLLHRVRAGLR